MLNKELSYLRADVERFDVLTRRLGDIRAMDELLADESDPEMEAELGKSIESLEHDVDRVELAAFLGGEYDRNDAVASLHAGAGGTESQDWAEMLLRMYLRWTDRTELSKRERQRARGTGPYSGNGPDAAAGMRSR